MATIRFADRLARRWIEPSRVFHGSVGLSLGSLRIAKQQGVITLLEQGARHPRDWQHSADEECRHFGVDLDDTEPVFPDALIQRMESEYQVCDHIVVPSAQAYESFAQHGHGEKTLIVHTGVDVEFFSPRRENEKSKLFRACYVGRVELAKGLGYLLQAWKTLALRDAELLLVGEVKPDVRVLLNTCATSSIRTVGFTSLPEVAEYYRQSSVFILPSANEGLAQVLLEAMASGLAIVATDKSGASECVTTGSEGLLVPARDANQLAGAILWCYQHPEQVQEMGKTARLRVESNFTLQHYNQRMIALYRSVAGAHKALSS